MCIAVPMKVVKVNPESHSGIVALSGNEMNVDMSLISPKIGDYVLVHAGCAIEVVKQEMADEILDIFQMLEEIAGNES